MTGIVLQTAKLECISSGNALCSRGIARSLQADQRTALHPCSKNVISSQTRCTAGHQPLLQRSVICACASNTGLARGAFKHVQMHTQPRWMARHFQSCNKHHNNRNMQATIPAFASMFSTEPNMFKIMILRLTPAEVSPIAAPAVADTALSMQPSMHAYAGAWKQASTVQLPVAASCFQALADATCNHVRLNFVCIYAIGMFACILIPSLVKLAACTFSCTSTNQAACWAAAID